MWSHLRGRVGILLDDIGWHCLKIYLPSDDRPKHKDVMKTCCFISLLNN